MWYAETSSRRVRRRYRGQSPETIHHGVSLETGKNNGYLVIILQIQS
uniref:Uncharacterized protein n=1 Tax=Klebsiella pneumoniae TaxID=573 RepID=A0A6H0A2X0_KLEPN|nr:hypothetical protein [Klebsiella pneumoniae]